MFVDLPATSDEFKSWPWSRIEPYYRDLDARDLNASNVEGWLADWTRLADLLNEVRWSLHIAVTLDTRDEKARHAYHTFLETILPPATAANQRLKEKLLASEIEPAGFAIPLRNLRAEAALFREVNLPLLAEQEKLITEYEEIPGSQTVIWEGQEITIQQLTPVYYDPDRTRRERAWRLAAERQLADRQALNDIWVRLMRLRSRIAENAGMPDFRAYRWQQMKRFDYTPEDCLAFHQAIEQVVVPAVRRIYERRREQLGVESLRPWDIYVDPQGRPPLHPYQTVDELLDKATTIFEHVDPQFRLYFETMRSEGLLDLENRPGKAPGAYSQPLDARRQPFIFQNAVGLHDDVMTLLHEAGHAFHTFESAHLPYHHQRADGTITMEVAEVASMSMELLAAPYLLANRGGFYDTADYARARIEHLEEIIRFWPYMAVVDAFQHWAYTHSAAATDPANCDAEWAALWDRFMVGIDYSDLDDVKMTGWQRKLHIFTDPFYYVDYGLAQLGAVQVWRNALMDQVQAVRQYRHALSLGCTVGVPDFYRAAGASFTFDASTLGRAVDMIEKSIAELEQT